MSETLAILCTDRTCRYAPDRHQAFPLCDDDGIVRKGAMHHGTDYECTSHAQFGGFHITCTSPAHPEAAHRAVTARYARASADYEAACMSGDPDHRAAAEVEFREANDAYSASLARVVTHNERPSFEDILRHPWSQPDPDGLILGRLSDGDAFGSSLPLIEDRGE